MNTGNRSEQARPYSKADVKLYRAGGRTTATIGAWILAKRFDGSDQIIIIDKTAPDEMIQAAIEALKEGRAKQ